MTPDQWLLLTIIVVPLILTAANRLRMDLAALLMAVILGILQFSGLGMLGPANAPADTIKIISGFSQPVVITLISLFIITRALEKSGVTSAIAHFIVKIGGNSEASLIALLTTTTAGLSLFMNNVAAGALVLPSALEVSRRTGIKPGKLLIPVAYGSLLGGMATYFTTANIIMSDLLTITQPAQLPLRFLDFTPTGGLIALVGIGLIALCAKFILPDSQPEQLPLIPANSPDVLPALCPNALWIVIITVAAVAASIAGVPVYLSMLTAAVLVLLCNFISMPEAFRAIEWQTIFLIAGMYVVSLSIVQTGLAALLGARVLAFTQHLGGLGLAATAYLLAMLINQFIGGQITAYIIGPMILSAAIHMGVNPQAIAVATAIGCSSAFLTPIAHPVNILMMAPGGYKFSDFLRAGWLLTLITFAVLMIAMKLFWAM